MPFNEGDLEQPQWIPYFDLAGGRNTKKDAHALERNQLTVSDNTWSAQGNTIAKRPGSISINNISAGNWGGISAGNTGLGVGFTGMVEGRFFNQTALVVQGTNNKLAAVPMALPAVSVGVNQWVSIGSVSGGTIMAAQLFDPDPTSANGPDGTLFIVDGTDTPKAWIGPGNALKPVVSAQLPTKRSGSSPITPKYVATLFSSLFYAGEPTDPSMVYISDPFRPQNFTSNLIIPTGTITGASYIGAPIGRSDGVFGGDITGLVPMGSAMVVYKQSAIYAMTQMGILGDMLWASAAMSTSVGALSPRSIVAFDTFHCFLGIDGVYTFDGTQTRKISANNPDLFDGPTAQILDRTTAVGVRQGNRYLIFYDNGAGTGVVQGTPNAGAWFDFDKPDDEGLPSVGTISGMNLAGVAPLRGPNDLGNFAWADSKVDRVGLFGGVVNGLQVFTDFGTAFIVSVTGKADFFSDIWGAEAALDLKNVDQAELLMSLPIISSTQSYTFNATILYDLLTSLASSGSTTQFPGLGVAVVGQAVVGTAQLGVLAGTPAYQSVQLSQPAPSSGYVVQFGFTEQSIYPWTSLGFILYVNRQRRTGSQSG